MNANTSAVGRSLTAPLRLKGGMTAIVHTAPHHGRRRNGQLPLFGIVTFLRRTKPIQIGRRTQVI
jgi:hypothetical protein